MDAEQVLREFADRMDVIALSEPKDRSWESIYKQARRELGERIASAAENPKQV